MTTNASKPVRLPANIYGGCGRCGGMLRLELEIDSPLVHDVVDYVCLQCGRHTPLTAALSHGREPGGSGA
jgi:hypothetical protein